MKITEELIESAAKATEQYRMKDYGWSQEQFNIWWYEDDRCDKEYSRIIAKIVLETAFPQE
jgi:hypothetical protein